MQQFNFILENFLRGRATYAPIRRILDVIFSVSIASFLFQSFYFKYQWMDITDYKGILNFLVAGEFIVPLILFLVAHYITYLLAYCIFSLTINKKSAKWIRNIVKYKIGKNDLNKATKQVNKLAKDKLPSKIETSWLIRSYLALKSTIDAEQWQRAENFLKKQQQIIEKNFLLLAKGIFAVSIYFATINHFGLFLFIFSIMCIIAGLIVLWYSYLVLEVLPTLIRKADFEMQEQIDSLNISVDQQITR